MSKYMCEDCGAVAMTFEHDHHFYCRNCLLAMGIKVVQTEPNNYWEEVAGSTMLARPHILNLAHTQWHNVELIFLNTISSTELVETLEELLVWAKKELEYRKSINHPKA